MGDLPEHVIMDIKTTAGIEHITDQISNYSQDKLVFIDNSIFCWMVDYLDQTKVKNLKPEHMNKATLQYEKIAEQLSTGKLYMPKEIANELRQSARLTRDKLVENIAEYQKLSDSAQRTHETIKTAMDEMKKSAEALYERALTYESQKENRAATELALFLERIKKYFKWGEKTRDKDIHLVANAFAQAIITQKEVYILSEDQDIEQTAECLYHLLACKNIGVPSLLKDHPARVSVLRAKGYDEYTISFTYEKKPIGENFAINGYLRDYYKKGSKLNKEAEKNNKEDSFDIAKRVTILLQTMLKSMPKTVSGPDAIPVLAEAESLRMEAERLEASVEFPEEPRPISPEINAIAAKALAEGALKDPAKTLETLRAIAEQKGKEEDAANASLTDIVEKEPFASSLEIIRDYARQAYEKTGETPEKKTAKSALEELADAGVDVKEDLRNIKETEIKQEINALATEIPQIKAEIKQIVDTKPEWDDDPEYNRLNQELTLKKAKKTELQSQIYKEPDETK